MDKYIDQLIENAWFMKIVALVLALLLFDYVYDGNETIIDVPQKTDTEVIENVPVKSYYDTENLVITGVPSTVKVTLKGPRNLLQQAKAQKSFEVYVDLSKADMETKRVKIKVKNISEKLKVTINPAYADISIHEKITKEFSVEADINQSLIAKGYVMGEPVVKPEKITITGAQGVIDKISYVKATVDLKAPISDTTTARAIVSVLDKNLNKLTVNVDPSIVEVLIPVKSITKEVPIDIVQIGTSPKDVTIDSISLNETKAIVTADSKDLKKIKSVRVEVDVSKITDDTVLNVPVIISKDVVEVSPKTVEVTIKVSKSENKTISNIPVEINGLDDPYEVFFSDPSNREIALSVSGSSDVIQSLIASDFNVFIDVSNLNVGKHNVPINVSGPDNVQWKAKKETAKITITERNQ